MSTDRNWLVDQLPRAMAADPVLSRFVTAFQEVAETVRDRVDGVEHQVDTGLASPEMLAYLASWLGLQLEPTDSAEYQRDLLRQAGKLLGWRGTRHGVEGLLGAATGARVEVSDGGGVFGQKDRIPPPDATVTVRLDHTGHLSERQVMAILEQEVPLGADIVLDVRYPSDDTGGTRRGR